MGPDDGLVDAPGTGLEDAPEAVEREVVADVVPAADEAVEHVDRAQHRRDLPGGVPVRRLGVVDEPEFDGPIAGGRAGRALPAGPELAGHDRRLAGPGLQLGSGQRRARRASGRRLRRLPCRAAPAPALASTDVQPGPHQGVWGCAAAPAAFPRPTGARRGRPGMRRREIPRGRRGRRGTHGLHPPSGVWKRSCGRAPGGSRQASASRSAECSRATVARPGPSRPSDCSAKLGAAVAGSLQAPVAGRPPCAARAASTRGARPRAASEPPAAPSRPLRVSPR